MWLCICDIKNKEISVIGTLALIWIAIYENFCKIFVQQNINVKLFSTFNGLEQGQVKWTLLLSLSVHF